MFIKLTRSGDRTYAQLVESFRDEHGRPRQRTLATLGRIDETGGQVDSLLGGLLRAKGRSLDDTSSPQVRFESALALGDVWALDQLWRELGFDSLSAVFRRARFTNPVEHALRVMVLNRLCDPDSKLGVLRWLQTVSMPGADTAKLTHQQLLRSMDALMDHQDAVDDCVAGLLRPLIDNDLSVVFYDLTTIRTEGLSELQGDVRRHGMSKEGLIARQFMLGVVQTADGMPIYHEVFAGNTSEAPTLQPTLKEVLARYPHIRRLIVVADRGLLSLDNIEELGKLRLKGDQPLEFILAVPGRRYGEFEEILAAFQAKAGQAEAEIVDEAKWQSLRLVVAHNPERAREQTDLRRQRIAALQARADELAGKLDGQDAGQVKRGRKLSDSGARARFFHDVADARLSRIIKVDLQVRLVHLRHRPPGPAAGGVNGRQVAAGDQCPGPDAARRRGPLQGLGRHRAGLQGAEVGDRDRAGLPSTARTHQGARQPVLHGADRLPSDASAAQAGKERVVAGGGPGQTAAHPAAQREHQRRRARWRSVDHQPRASRSPRGTEAEETHPGHPVEFAVPAR